VHNKSSPTRQQLRRWPGSLRSRFLLALILVALLGVGTVALVANRVTAEQFTLYLNRGGEMRAQRWAQVVADYLERTGSWEGVESVLIDASSDRGIGGGRGRGPMMGMGMGGDLADTRFLIVDDQGRVIVDTEGTLVGESMDVDYQEHGAPIVIDGRTLGTLLATTVDLSGRSELERRFIDSVNRAVLVAVLLVMVASIIAALLLARQLVRPLRRLTAAAEAMAAGDLAQRVEVHSHDEVGELGQAFNQMASDLQMAETVRRQMTADIAHELRNPLSVIRGNLEGIQDGVYSPDTEHLATIYEETLLLQRLVEDLRLLSLADAGQLQLIRTDVDVGELLAGVTESARAVAEDKGVILRLDVAPEPIRVEGDIDRLRQVFSNLVSNALRYTPEGGTIALDARTREGGAQITVCDTGIGISVADLPHVFDRFYRGSSARDRASGGSGLGLAIARALVEAHGGTITVESTVGQGTTFTVTL
jgi:signal transduction histidine kinase